MANKEQINALEVKLSAAQVELKAAQVEIETLNTCKLTVQNQLELRDIAIQRLEKTRDTLEESLINSKKEIRSLKELIKTRDDFIRDKMNERGEV